MLKRDRIRLRLQRRELALGLMLLIVASSIVTMGPAFAASTRHLRAVRVADDAFMNYDFIPSCTSQIDPTCPRPPTAVNPHRVDWPLNLLFWEGANTSVVATRMTKYNTVGSLMYGRINDGAEGDGPEWVGDGGIKTKVCPKGGGAAHFRRYKNGDQLSSYTTRWGFYFVASSHIDFRECSEGGYAGYSEAAERRIARDASQVSGWIVRRERLNWGNHERLRREGRNRHVWHNSGMATTIFVPPDRP